MLDLPEFRREPYNAKEIWRQVIDDPVFRACMIAHPLSRAGIDPAHRPIPAKLTVRHGALGSRKSWGALREIGPDERVLILIPDHALAEQHVATLAGFGRTDVAHYVSQTYTDPETGRVCKYWDIADRIARLGGYPGHLCQLNGVVCPHATDCRHFKGAYGEALQAKIVIAPVSILPHAIKNHAPFDRMIIDECPLLGLLQRDLFYPRYIRLALGYEDPGYTPKPGIEIDIADHLIRALCNTEQTWITLDDLPSYPEIEMLKEALQRMGLSKSKTPKTIIRPGPDTGAASEWLDGQAAKHPGLRFRKDAINLIDRVLDAMRNAHFDGRLTGLKPTPVTFDEDANVLRRWVKKDGIERALPGVDAGIFSSPSRGHILDTLLLTSTPAPKRAYGQLYREVEFEDGEWQHGEHTEYVFVSGNASWRKLVQNSTDGELSAEAKAIVNAVNNIAERGRQTTAVPGTMLFSTESKIAALAPSLSPRVEGRHYAILRGKNDMMDRKNFFLVGQPSPFPEELRLLAELLEGKPIDGVEAGMWWQMRPARIRLPGGKSVLAKRRTSPVTSWALDAVRAMVQDFPYIQADRSRALVPREDGVKKAVYLLGWQGDHLPFRISRHVTLSELAAGPFEELWERKVAISPDAFHGRAQLLSALLPHRFATAKQASKWLEWKNRPGTFAEMTARHGFTHTRDGKIRLGRYWVPVIFDAPDLETARHIALELPLPPGAVIHIDGIDEDIVKDA